MFGLLYGSAILLTGCGSKVEATRPLVDSQHAADVLVERHVLSNARSFDQNRLLRGWRYVRGSGGPRLTPVGSESVVELINLKPRPREMQISVPVSRPDFRPRVHARLGTRDLGDFVISNGSVTIPLPADLPLGRVAVTLEFTETEGPDIEEISVTPCLAPGEVEIDDDRITQSGWSLVEVSSHVLPGSRFIIDFHPPKQAEPRQRFAITVDRDSGDPQEIFSWEPGGSAGTSKPRSVTASLGDEAGFVRIRLIAEGRGPAGSWIEPQIIEGELPSQPPINPTFGEPPRLVVLYVMDALRSDHVGHLTRRSHQLSATAGDARHPAGFSHLRVLDVPSSTPPRPSDRKPTWARRLTGLATKPGEIRGLGVNEHLTPILDGIASEGATFTNHFAVAPNTPPSTRALFSGLCMLDDRQLPSPGPTRLAEVFREAGYRTVSITGNPHLSAKLDLGTGFESVELLRVREDHNPKHPPTVNNSAEILHEAALRWIDNLGPGERGFMYIHSMNPHNPYTPPRELADRLAPPGASTIDGRTRTLVAIRDLQRDVESEDMDRLRKLYAAGVAYNDRELGILLDEINRRFDPEQVLIAITSDHGEELFEHDGVLHGYSLYDEMLRIPLILRWPGNIETGTIGSLTNTLDLHASMVELAVGDVSDSTGSSLWPLIAGTNTPDSQPRLTFAAAPGLAGATMARSDRWKLIRSPRDGPDRGQGKGRGRSWDVEYVFDLINDPEERHNLAGTDELERAWLRTRLMAWIEAQRALQPSPGNQVMDDETKDQLEALGYVVDD